MSDLIDRQAAIDDMKDMYHAAEKWGKEASDDVIKARAESCMASLIEMKLRIEKLPSAQPERKVGKWVDGWSPRFDGTRHWFRECSECGYKREDDNPEKDTNYCPNCGCAMKGEEE